MDSSEQAEGLMGSSDPGGPGSSFTFPPFSSYQFPIGGFPGFPPFGYRRGPGRPRKDGNVPYQRQAGRGHVGRIRNRNQLFTGFQQRFSQSSSSPSTSSPDTPHPGDSPLMDTSVAMASNDGPKCSFCFLPESSLLGQGELLRHPKSADFDPQSVALIKREPEQEQSENVGDSSQIRVPNLPRRPKSKEELSLLYQRSEIFSEIEIVGLPADVTILDLINQTSEFKIWAHFCCGAWSDGVIQAEDYSLINVDKAVAAGLRQRCSGCGSYGATISCRQKGCTKKFHYPCASGYGGFLDIKGLVFLCPEHASKAPDIVGKDADCFKCKKSSGVQDQLFCTSCGQHFHGRCLDPPVEPCLQTRAGWLCNECKICQTCKNSTDDDKMLVCESCDKGYHTYCMQPPLSTVPKQTWKCKFCRVCKDCGSRRPGSGTSSRWHLNFSICDSCYQQRNKGLVCPVCNRAYRHQRQKSMMQCQNCQKYIHYECDPQSIPQGVERPEVDFYVCPICKKQPELGVFGGFGSASASVSASPSISTVGEGEEEDEYLANFMKTELGDSLSGTESPFSEFGPAFVGEVDFDSLTTPDDSNLSGVHSGSESGFGRPHGLAPLARKFGSGNALSRKKQQYRRSRSGGKAPEGFKSRLPAPTGRRRGRPAKYSALSVGVSSTGEEMGGMRGKEKDDEEYIHTVVVASAKDEFLLSQDMCVICGSIGKGEEGRLIACTQCGQCYHPYCANVKMSSVVLRRGWRCLDCTVCEGCGQGEDEPHLLLCDECDVSYHTYCLEPPLQHIPQGAWRCHWCAKCERCGNLLPAVSSIHSIFPTNFCVACESLCRCARCNQQYREGDQMIVCQNCGRWCHGKCEALLNEELLETASERGFRCVYCRPPGTHCLQTPFSSFMVSEDDAITAADGVVLTKPGVDVTTFRLPSSTPVPNAMGAVRRHLNDSRSRGAILAGAHRAIEDTIDEVTAAVAKTFTNQVSEDFSTVEFDQTEDMSSMLSPLSTNDVEPQPKRRGRKVPKLGVGGFVVKPARQRTTTVDEPCEGGEAGVSVSEDPLGGEYNGGMISPAMDNPGERPGQVKQRRKRRPRKGIIEDSYPTVIQDSFFGPRCIPDSSTVDVSRQSGSGTPVLEEQNQAFSSLQHNDTELNHISADQLRKQEAGTGSDAHGLSLDELDDDLFRTISGDPDMLVDSESLFKMLDNIGGSGLHDSRGHSPIGNNDIDSNPLVTDLGDVDNLMNQLNPTLEGSQQVAGTTENLNPVNPENFSNGDIKREQSDTIETPCSITPQHAPDNQLAPPAVVPPPQDVQYMTSPPEEMSSRPPQGQVGFPLAAVGHQHGIPGVGPGFFAGQMGNPGPVMENPGGGAPPGVFTGIRPGMQMGFVPPSGPRPLMSPTVQPSMGQTDPPPPVQSQTSTGTSSGSDLKSQMERWEQDEPLGDKSTIASVLYSNVNHPDFKTKYPTWQERVKHIMKQWRVLNSEERAKWVQTARDNRAACRQKRKNSKAVGAGSATPPTPVPQGPILKQEFGPVQSELSRSPLDSSPSTPYTTGSRTPSAPMENPLGQGPYSPRGPRPLFSDAQQMPRIPFSQEAMMGQRFPNPQQQQMRYQHPPPDANNPFKVPQRPEGPQSQDVQCPQRPSSLVFRAPSPAQQTPNPQNPMLLDELMDIERRERSQGESGVQNPLTVNVAPQFGHPGFPPQQGWPPRFPMGHGEMMRPMMPGQPVFKDAQHEALVRKQEELNSQQKAAEDELARLRKNKKNLAAKQRQLKKQELELSDDEKIHLETLTRDIQDRQKRVEYAKKQVKQNAQQLHDYEIKKGLAPPATSPGGPRMQMHPGPGTQQQQLSPIYQQSLMQQGQQAQMMSPPRPPFLMRAAGMQMNPRLRVGVPGTYPQGVGSQASSGMTSPYKVMQGDTNPFSETFEERERIERQKQAMYGVRPMYPPHQMQGFHEGQPPRFPTPLGGDSCDSAGSQQSDQKKKVYKKRRKKSDPASEFGPAADMLMRIPRPPLDDLDSPIKDQRTAPCGLTGSVRDVYETVQFLVDRVCFEADGDEGDRNGNALLKSLLETSSPTDRDTETGQRPKSSMGRPPSAASGMKRAGAGGGPNAKKRVKKGPKGRLAPLSSYDDYAVFVERVAIELKGLPRLSVQEPFPRADRFSCQIQGLSNLPEGSDKPLVVAEDFGQVGLSFLADYFKEDFGKPPQKQPPVVVTPGVMPEVESKGVLQPSESSSQLLALRDKRESPEAQLGQTVPPSLSAPRSIIEHLKSLDESPLELVYENRNGEQDDEEFSLAYPALKLAIPPEGRLSSNFRLMLAIPTMRPVPPDPPRELFYKVAHCTPAEMKREKEVPCSVTLSIEAAKNVSNVMQGLALLLNLASPIDYHIETPPHTPEKEMSIRDVQDQSAQQCHRCQSLVHQEVVKKRFAELGLTPKEDDKDFVLFCSSTCYSKFASLKTPLTSEEMVEMESVISAPNAQDIMAPAREEMQLVKVDETKKEPRAPRSGGAEDLKLDEIIRSVVGGVQTFTGGPKEIILHVRDLPEPESSVSEGRRGKGDVKRWKGHRWQTWNKSFVANLTRYQEQLNSVMDELKWIFCPRTVQKDRRRCELCGREGDSDMQGSGRLLNMDAARWVHVNCALWSSEVYETVGGALINVDAAVRRGQTVACVHCAEMGATIQCYKLRCEQQYHFPCAMELGCCFTPDKTLLCPEHKLCEKDIKQMEVSKLAVLRRVYIERDEDHLIAKLFQQGDVAGLTLRVGSLIFHHIGQLLPHQLKAFHTKDFVFPVGYSVTRFYWSPAFVNRRVKYHCSIAEHSGGAQFVISFSDSGCSELTLRNSSASEAWNRILEPLENLRHKKGPSDQLKLFPRYLTGELLFGLTEPSILKMIESLPGVDTLLTYNFKYGRNPLMDLPLAVNPSGCARTEPRFRTYLKRHHITHAAGSSSSGSAPSPTGGSLTWQELALMFGKLEKEAPGTSSKWSLYKKMKTEWRNTVHLGRSKIQGLGLYAKRDIEMNSMIIEYLGDVIRNEVAERREKLYQQQNRGVYMFRLDSEKVVDATMSGGPARYINHSCDPNCATQLITINGELKIVVMACRPISKHEELTYDYQFDFEDESSKIPCLCGAPNCRKWMN